MAVERPPLSSPTTATESRTVGAPSLASTGTAVAQANPPQIHIDGPSATASTSTLIGSDSGREAEHPDRGESAIHLQNQIPESASARTSTETICSPSEPLQSRTDLESNTLHKNNSDNKSTQNPTQAGLRESKTCPRKASSEAPSAPRRSNFLRAIGLDVWNTFWGRFSSKTTEPKKQLVQASLLVALQRSAIHLLPSCISIIIICLSLRGYFIGYELAGISGRTTQDLAALQIAAKIQEFLILASLAAVIFHKIRYDLTHRGVPFGLVGSGISFSQLSYFWSLEFIGALRSRSNAILIGMVMYAGILAVVTGPSVAILLIPRSSEWPAGGTTYYINGSADDLWPSQVGLDHYLPLGTRNSTDSIDCSSPYGYSSPLCPSGGYISFLNHFSSNSHWQYPEMSETHAFAALRQGPYTPLDTFYSGTGILMRSGHGQVVPYVISGAMRGWSALETSSFAIHSATASLQQRLNFDWYEAVMSSRRSQGDSYRYQFYGTQRASVVSQVPAARVVCSPALDLTEGETGVTFPWVPEYGLSSMNYATHLGYNISYIPSLANHSYSDSLKITWANLTSSPLITTTVGMIFEAPWYNTTSRLVSGCIIDARWANATVLSQYPQAFQAAFNAERSNEGGHANEAFLPVRGPMWRRINVTEEWLNAINFQLPDEILGTMPDGATSIEALISAMDVEFGPSDLGENVGNPNTLTIVEHVVASVFVDALARIGSWRTFNTSKPATEPMEYVLYEQKPDYNTTLLQGGEALYAPPDLSTGNYTRFQMSQTITGYAYKAQEVTDFLALAVLFTHIVAALGHTIYLVVTRKSSECWDRLPELLALAQQSTPSTHVLQNTAAGIYRSDPFKHKAKVRPTEEDDTHLEMFFDSDGRDDMVEYMDPLEEYG